jgi:hypothetical protein
MGATAMLIIHVGLSLAGIVCGLIAFAALAGGRDLRAMTYIFLATTFLTDVTGFFLPKAGFGDPPTLVGIISLVFMLIALACYYVLNLAGRARWIFILSAGLGLYLNCFVGVIQAFQKISILHALAPAGNEPPFAVAQVSVVLLCVVLGVLAVRRLHPRPL